MSRKSESRIETVADTPQMAQELLSLVEHPEDIDAATDRLGIPALLMNPHLSTAVDLSDAGLGAGVHIPVQISKQRGGRKSLYYLQPGEKIMAGIIATATSLLFRYVARETGRSIPAQAGDQYVEELRSASGSVISQLRGRLEITNTRKGEGRLVFDSPASPEEGGPAGRKVKVSLWYLWSCYKGEVEVEI